MVKGIGEMKIKVGSAEKVERQGHQLSGSRITILALRSAEGYCNPIKYKACVQLSSLSSCVCRKSLACKGSI